MGPSVHINTYIPGIYDLFSLEILGPIYYAPPKYDLRWKLNVRVKKKDQGTLPREVEWVNEAPAKQEHRGYDTSV